MVETGFVTPGPRVFAELVAGALRAAGEDTRPDPRSVIEHGSANLVVLAGRTAVRVGRDPQASAQLERAQRLIDALPELPFGVPRSVAEPVRAGGLTAIAQRRVPGEPHPSGSGDPEQLGLLLASLRAVPLEIVDVHLAPPRVFMGGDAWRRLMHEEAIPRLDAAVRPRAERIADALSALEPPAEAVLTHGDLAGANVLWSDGRVAGVVDWDLASAGDPAEDVAALATWHGWEALRGVVDADVERRAQVIAATYPLQLVCFGIAHGRPDVEVSRAVDRANRRLAAQTDVTPTTHEPGDPA
ncbi:phosphotransferase family protein [Leifsonia shinshuensis]|uniref:Phosphotransferase n=1 Tax=Leifsonia shinshuensis TaxID=150026 RepID=A0A7G6Y972_9MICO|nr:phosphotransferase [Leifsonia shinshuensis]QNE35037.1 phosphotransferase [Leifsonia shinshuensis]